MTPGWDPARAEELAHAATEGHRAAFSALSAHLWPEIVSLVGSSRSMSARRDEDSVREVATRVLEKLERNDRAALRQLAAWQGRHPDKTFSDWLRIVVTNAARDYLRERRGAANPNGMGPTSKQLLNECAVALATDELSTRPPFTAAQAARQILTFAQARLPDDQLEALAQWLTGSTFEDMARGLGGCDPASVKQLVRAAIATLRRTFAGAS
jgi:DNA-directed RNA polymerase specialized sigma24 family protein